MREFELIKDPTVFDSHSLEPIAREIWHGALQNSLSAENKHLLHSFVQKEKNTLLAEEQMERWKPSIVSNWKRIVEAITHSKAEKPMNQRELPPLPSESFVLKLTLPINYNSRIRKVSSHGNLSLLAAEDQSKCASQHSLINDPTNQTSSPQTTPDQFAHPIPSSLSVTSLNTMSWDDLMTAAHSYKQYQSVNISAINTLTKKRQYYIEKLQNIDVRIQEKQLLDEQVAKDLRNIQEKGKQQIETFNQLFNATNATHTECHFPINPTSQ